MEVATALQKNLFTAHSREREPVLIVDTCGRMLYDVRMAIKNFAATRLGFLFVLPLTN
jgi:hypothetical protein